MKKHLFAVLVAALIAGGCAGSTTPSAPASAPAETPAEPAASPSAPAIAGSAEPEMKPFASEDALRQVQSELEPYVELEITFLGAVSQERTLDDILARAAASGSCAGEIDDSRIFYGDRGEYTDNVYLLVPALNTDLKIGRYNWYAGEITETWVEETEALPLIYVEDGDLADPPGRIEYVRHLKDGDSEGILYTGIGLDGKLRTAYHMGVTDPTDYGSFDSSEIPFYAQSLHDRLMSFEEVSDAVNAGAKLSVMQEMTWDGHVYMVYDLENGGTNTLYGVRPDSGPGYSAVLVSRDRGMSWETLGQG